MRACVRACARVCACVRAFVCVCMRACVRACLCVCVYMCGCSVRGIQYSDYNFNYYIRGLNVYVSVDLVKHGVQTLVPEIRLYRNGRCYYYIAAQMPQSPD